MITVTLSFPNGRQRPSLLSRVPNVGEFIQLSNGDDEPPMVVMSVVHIEAGEGRMEPDAIVSVRAYQEGPK